LCRAGPCNVLNYRRRVDRPGHPKGPGEGPAPHRKFGASLIGVQPRTSAGHAPTRIRDNRRGGILTGRVRRHDDAEQLSGLRPVPAPDTRSDRG